MTRRVTRDDGGSKKQKTCRTMDTGVLNVCWLHALRLCGEDSQAHPVADADADAGLFV